MKRKATRPKVVYETQPLLASRPGQLYCIDFVGPLTKTPRGNTHLLVMIDAFTRWPIAVPTKDEKAETVAKIIYEHLITERGTPEILLSDRAQNFLGAVMSELRNRFAIRGITTSGLQPQMNQVERLNRTLITQLSTVVHSLLKHDWDELVHSVLFAIRISVNESTGYSPFYLEYGRHPNLPFDLLFDFTREEFRQEGSYASALAERLASAYRVVRQHQLRMASKNADYRNKALRPLITYEAGDTVLFWDPSGADKSKASPKLHLRWSGPHVITEKISDVHYRMDHSTTKNNRVVNINRLQPFNCWSSERPITDPPYWGEVDECEFLEPPPGYKVRKHTFCVVALINSAAPFAVARCMTRHNDGRLLLQWYGNEDENPLSTHKPCWKHFSRRLQQWTWYASDKPRHRTHTPYTTEDTGSFVREHEVYVPGFRLRRDGRLPRVILDILSDADAVDWTLPSTYDTTARQHDPTGRFYAEQTL